MTQTSAGFLCAGDLRGTPVRSDASWISRYDQARKRDVALYSFQLDFQEHVDGSLVDRDWLTSREPPAALNIEERMSEGGDPSNGSGALIHQWHVPGVTAYGAMPWHDLEARGIPQMAERKRVPVSIASEGSGTDDTGYRDWYNLAKGLFGTFGSGSWKKRDEPHTEKGFVLPSQAKGRFAAVVVDFGEEVVGPASVVVRGGSAGTVVDFFYGEALKPDSSPLLLDPDFFACRASMSNRLILAEGETRFDFFHILGFRYAAVVVHESPTPLSVSLSMSDTGYPYSLGGSFESSDKTLVDIWRICRRTEQVCSLDSYVDTPWREQAQWWGDARIQFWNTMAMDGDSRLFARGIRSVGRQKVPNGLTYGHAPTMAHNCILPDFSLVWIATVHDYYRETGDLSIFEEQLPRIREVLSYFRTEAPRISGLLAYDRRYWLFLDWSNLAKEGAPTLYNQWYLLALRFFGEMLSKSGRSAEAAEVAAEAASHERLIDSLLFDGDKGLFHDGLGEAGLPSKVHSVHSQVFAVLLGLKPESKKRMFDERILPFLRGEKLDVPVPSTYWTSYAIQVARENGFRKEAIDFIKRMWSPWIEQGACWEMFDQKPGEGSMSHAWSAHPLFHLMDTLGGVVQKGIGWAEVDFDPFFAPGMDSASIRRPTPLGVIEASWKRSGAKIEATITLPAGITARVLIPGQEASVTGTRSFTIS